MKLIWQILLLVAIVFIIMKRAGIVALFAKIRQGRLSRLTENI